MATVTRDNLGLLNDKLTLTLSKEDYLPAFERSLKDYSKKANIPGFRKGMVPAGLIKKMYGSSLFTDEVLRSVDRELGKYLEEEKLDIFAQPLPAEVDLEQLNMNLPADYHFSFEVGLKPGFQLPDLGKAATTRYKVHVTEEMIDKEVERLQNRSGNMKVLDTVDSEENVLNVTFTEANENGDPIEAGTTKDNSLLVKYFAGPFRQQWMGKHVGDFIQVKLKDAFEEKEREWIISDLGLSKEDPSAIEKTFRIELTKIGLLEKKELNEEFFKEIYPDGDVLTESDFRNKIRSGIQSYWDAQARNQLHDQLYHLLLDKTEIEFPEGFLKKWMKTQGEKPKSEEEVEEEFPGFLNQLKWSLVTDKIVTENTIQVTPDEIRNFAKQELFGYMGNMGTAAEDQPWVNDYIEKMMKDRKYVENSFSHLQTQKIFEWGETKLNPTEQSIDADAFTKMVEEHHH
jgi:trigger factor